MSGCACPDCPNEAEHTEYSPYMDEFCDHCTWRRCDVAPHHSVAVTALLVDVIGTPAPQGSKRHVGNGVMIESSRKVGPWRDSVAYAVHAEILSTGWTAPNGPVSLEIVFRLPRPRTAPKTRLWPFQRPDVSKLLRSTEDAITTAGGWHDDAQVVHATVEKRYALPGEATGASIKIRVIG